MPAYDSTGFQPPAPVGRVSLRNPETGATWSDVPLLIDTGADVTLVPLQAVTRLGLMVAANREYELIGFDGSTSIASIVQLELIFCQRTFRGQFLLIDQECGVLGRNVLNNVPLLLDGPRLEWSEARSA
jgi:predicted aspartyl protease